MSNLALIYPNLASTGTFTATNDAGFPEANLATTRADKIYQRTATVTTLTVDLDLGAGNALIGSTNYGIVWGGTTLGDGAQMSIITDDNSGFSSATTVRSMSDLFNVTLGNPAAWEQPWGRHGIHLGSVAIERYLRFSFTESGGTVLDGAFVFAGPVWTPGNSYDIGWRSTDEPRPGGMTRRGLEMTFSWLTPSEASALVGILRQIGAERRVFIVPQTDRAETWLSESILARRVSEPVVTEHHDAMPARYKRVAVKFLEVDY
jgi:hypothetical protein